MGNQKNVGWNIEVRKIAFQKEKITETIEKVRADSQRWISNFGAESAGHHNEIARKVF